MTGSNGIESDATEEIKAQMPDAIRQIANDADRRLAWDYFVFFSRFEYALKENNYLKMTPEAKANWTKFATRHNDAFNPEAKDNLARSIEYLKKHAPRNQLRSGGRSCWSEPIKYDKNQPLLPWLVNVICIIRNNLFHGGKFNRNNPIDASRDNRLLSCALTVLDGCLYLDRNVADTFHKDITH